MKTYDITAYTESRGRWRKYLSSGRLDFGHALGWLVDELPGDAWTVTFTDADGNELPGGAPGITRTRWVIDWSKVPGDPAYLPPAAPENDTTVK